MPRKKKQDPEMETVIGSDVVNVGEEDTRLSLRKASRIHGELRTLVKERERDIRSSVMFDDPDTVDEILTEARMDSNSGNQWINDAEQVFSRLDSSIYEAKAKCGLNVLISEDARFKRLLARLEETVNSKPHKGRDHIKKTLSKKLERANQNHYSEPSIHSSILSEQEMREQKDSIRKIRVVIRNMKDKLLEKNVSTLITIPKDDWEFLKEESLI